ncbi:polyubiquitin [Biomphalaria glabrata]|nr:polyubiquitin-like [Biomphalaria glabrata]
MDAQRDPPNRPFQLIADTHQHAVPQQPQIKTTPHQPVQKAVPQQPNLHTTARQPPQHAVPQQPQMKTTPHQPFQEAVTQQPNLHTTARQPPQHAVQQQPEMKTTPHQQVQEAVPQQPNLHTTPRQPHQHAVPQQPSEPNLQVIVKNFADSKNYAISVKPNTLIQDFMNQITNSIKGYVPNTQQMLTYAGKVLESGATIADYGIQRLFYNQKVEWNLKLDQVDGGTDSILGSISINDTPKTLFQIFVLSYTDSTTHTFKVMESFSVKTLMTMIHQRLGIPPDQQRLQYAGKNLEGDKPLSFFEIQKECTLYLTGRLRGG